MYSLLVRRSINILSITALYITCIAKSEQIQNDDGVQLLQDYNYVSSQMKSTFAMS